VYPTPAVEGRLRQDFFVLPPSLSLIFLTLLLPLSLVTMEQQIDLDQLRQAIGNEFNDIIEGLRVQINVLQQETALLHQS
jgi:hypothetical protein